MYIEQIYTERIHYIYLPKLLRKLNFLDKWNMYCGMLESQVTYLYSVTYQYNVYKRTITYNFCYFLQNLKFFFFIIPKKIH